MKKCTSESGNHEHCEDIEYQGDTLVVCHDCETTLGKKCEIYARPCGYLSPVHNWNIGKKAEFPLRKKYKVE